MTKSTLPQRLYKYRAFNVNTLRLLSEAEVYYADPADFNDPLDCSPTIEIDTDRSSLEKLCYKMLLATNGADTAKRLLNEHRYMSTEYGGDYRVDRQTEEYYMRMLASRIKGLLHSELGKRGVLSLAEKWDCPLMWSHYADNHRGLCLEYLTAENACGEIKAVDYLRPRSIKVSDLIKWKIKQSSDAEKAVLNTFFFAKAPQWRYEREWRKINQAVGTNSASFQISAIYFGLRCDASVKTTIVKLHSNSARQIKFYGIYPLNDSFRLKRRLVDVDEIEACGLRSSAILDFKNVFIHE